MARKKKIVVLADLKELEERCILDLKKKQPKICAKRNYPRTTKYRGKRIRCYNPFAVCKAAMKKKQDCKLVNKTLKCSVKVK